METEQTTASMTETPTSPSPSNPPDADAKATTNPLYWVRAAIAGVLMGIANLIPGVSGGTMILAVGLYEDFIESVAAVTALRFTARRLAFLAVVGGFAAGSIVGLAAVILSLLFHYPIAMFALFIGLTLGGAPLLAREIRPLRVDVALSAGLGLALMIGIALLKPGGGFPHGMAMDFVSGVVGATTMVLPGISGSYMLLVLDQYDRVVGAVSEMKDALSARNMELLTAALKTVVPVGIGAVLGVIALSHLLKFLLARYHRVTVGVLLGILLGSVVGLWPFSQAPGKKALEKQESAALHQYADDWGIEGADTIQDHDALVQHILTNWTSRTTSPFTPTRIGLAAAMVVVGFMTTLGLSRLQRPTS